MTIALTATLAILRAPAPASSIRYAAIALHSSAVVFTSDIHSREVHDRI